MEAARPLLQPSAEGEGLHAAAGGPRASGPQPARRDLSWQQVLQEEEEHLTRLRAVRGARGSAPISVAFSGGGTRAASFQAGVLWRMAECKLLRHVDYFVAVSGGGYIASAFASHILKSGGPGRTPNGTEDLDRWYLNLVAKTIVRFQDNIGYIVRDPCRKLRARVSGTGTCSRICDIPLLLLTTLFTISVKPVLLFFMFTIPLSEGIELFFGSTMRASFCAWGSSRLVDVILSWFPMNWLPRREPRFWHIFAACTPWGWLVSGLVSCVMATTVFWSLGILPCFRTSRPAVGQAPRRSPLPHLVRHSALAALARVIVVLLSLLALVSGCTCAQVWEYSAAHQAVNRAWAVCRIWNITEAGAVNEHSAAITGKSPWRKVLAKWNETRHCSDFSQHGPWFRIDSLVPHLREDRGDMLQKNRRVTVEDFPDRERVRVVSASMAFMWLILVAIGVILAPWFPGIFQAVVFFAGPSALLVLLGAVVQFRVFGPMTGQCMFTFWRWACVFPFNHKVWDTITLCSFCASLVAIPFYDRLHGSMHQYYERSLQLAFFEGGKDWPMGDLKENLFCPLFLYTATANDHMRPGDTKQISEITFSPLHTGGQQTGYVRSPVYRSLVKCTALGSAATDALVLGIIDQLRYRFWLEAVNLKMGDFILFDVDLDPLPAKWLKRAFPSSGRPMTWCFVRLPSLMLHMCSCMLMLVGYLLTGDRECGWARVCFGAGVAVALGVYVLSFFGFAFRCLTVSPGLRQIHLATRACQMSELPPAMIYVTDGGVQDCTGLVQLMRRRCECILLVIGFDDPNDELRQLRDAMDLAIEEGLGWFYDLEDPRRSFKLTLDELKRGKFKKTYFRLGIRYGWELEPENAQYAELFVVKNRLPPNYDTRIKKYITEAEVRGEAVTGPNRRGWSHLLQTDLGGCCCNCCHLRGCNCGDKFPHNFTGFQCLTPQHFNSLCRLGHHLSEEVIELLMQRCNDHGSSHEGS